MNAESVHYILVVSMYSHLGISLGSYLYWEKFDSCMKTGINRFLIFGKKHMHVILYRVFQPADVQ